MIINLLIEQHLEFLSLKGGGTGSAESTLIKIPHCWKSHVVVQIVCLVLVLLCNLVSFLDLQSVC